MCGIAGFFTPRPTEHSLAILERMGERIAHRGPDDRHQWFDYEQGIFLHFRRLAIIDLSREGRQPRISSDRRWVICFNGEIYNAEELREQLRTNGAHFLGRADSEVLTEAIATWGFENTLMKLDGMFAIAAWNTDERALYLARDRAGEKPLYYGWGGSAFLFGSELKALRAHPDFDVTLDPEAIDAFHELSYIPAPLSIYRAVRKLVAGHWVRLATPTVPASLPEPTCYWSAERIFEEARHGRPAVGRADRDGELETRLRRAIRVRTDADVPIGAFLSGGIDSSLIVSLMQAQSTQSIRTFTLGFENHAVDESRFARPIAEYLQTEHTEVILTEAETAEALEKLPSIYDEPFADPSQLPTYFISRVARESVKVAIVGDGADELFGGYPRYRWLKAIENFRRISPAAIRHALAGALGSTRSARVCRLAEVLRAETDSQIYRALLRSPSAPAGASYRSPRSLNASGATLAEKMMWHDFVGFLGDGVLTKLDRASMSVGLETRCPFLDSDLIQFAWGCPQEDKWQRDRSKPILRRLLARQLPVSLFERPKRGFVFPLADWLRGPLRPRVEHCIARASSAESRRLWIEHAMQKRDHSLLIWKTVIWQSWLENGPG